MTMDIKSFMARLHDSEEFKSALSAASNDKERRAIKAIAEEFVSRAFENVLKPLHDATQKDPSILKKAFIELDKGLINSGSTESTKT